MPRARRRPPSGSARYLAPAAFLVAVTVAAVLIHSGLQGHAGSATTTRGPVTHAATTRTPPPGTTRKATTTLAGETYTVQSGDTFGSISAKTGVSIAQLEELNPDVSSNSLQVGQRLRVK